MIPRVVLYRCSDPDCGCGFFLAEEVNPQFGAEPIAAGSLEAVEAAKRLLESGADLTGGSVVVNVSN